MNEGSFGKVFRSIYNGSLHGHWHAIVAMQQLLVLCDSDGVVDMTPQAIAATTSIPLEILELGIEHLEQPDPYSRTSGDEGRRLVRLSSARPWGWRIVNHAFYRLKVSREQKQERDRDRQRVQRETAAAARDSRPSPRVASGRSASPKSRQAEAEAEAEADTEAENTKQGGAPFIVRLMRPIGSPAVAGEPAALPLSDRRSEAVLSSPMIAELAGLYPGVDVAAQLRGMRAWLLSKPTRRKTRGGLIAFVNTWLSKEQNTAPGDLLEAGARKPRRSDAAYLNADREGRRRA